MARKRTKRPTDELFADPTAYAETHVEERAASPEDYVTTEADEEPPHNTTLTGVAAEAARSGLYPEPDRPEEVPGEDKLLRAGDPDVDPLRNLYSGEELPGGSTSTPDQGNVDDMGRAYGLTDQDTGALRSAEELAERRDAHRWDKEALPQR
jgi:hypothetical protein